MSAGEIVEPIAVAMIATSYIGYALIIGLALLFSCALPWGFLRRARAVAGALFLLVALGIFLWVRFVYAA
jgi:hypothetical protein